MSAQVTEAHRELARRIMFEFTQAGTATESDVRMAAQLIADSEAKAVQSAQDIKSEWAYATMNERNQLRAERDQLRAEVERQSQVSAEVVGEASRQVAVSDKLFREARSEVEKAKGYIALQVARAERAEAEVERLKAQVALDEKAKATMLKVFHNEQARAECAEAEVKKLTGFYNEIVAECGHDRIVREYRQRGELLRDEANRRKEAEAELANIRALANRRNKRDHSQDTIHQLVAALDQALDIAQAELAAERKKVKRLTTALEDAISTYDPDRKETLVTAERQEAWIAALKGGDK